MDGESSTQAANHLFTINQDAEVLDHQSLKYFLGKLYFVSVQDQIFRYLLRF